MGNQGLSTFTPIQIVNAHLQSRDFQDSFPSFRESAQDYFTKSGFPTSKTEAWRFTNISPILKTKFEYHHHQEENKDQIPAPTYADKCLKIDILNGRVAGKSLDHLSFETEGILLNIISINSFLQIFPLPIPTGPATPYKLKMHLINLLLPNLIIIQPVLRRVPPIQIIVFQGLDHFIYIKVMIKVAHV